MLLCHGHPVSVTEEPEARMEVPHFWQYTLFPASSPDIYASPAQESAFESSWSTINDAKEVDAAIAVDLQLKQDVADSRQAPPEFFIKRFFQKDQEMAKARAAYFKILIPGVIMVSITILSIFSIFWGAMWKVPAHTFAGWIVDFDGGEVGQIVIEGLNAAQAASGTISWEVVPSSRFPEGAYAVAEEIKNDGAWIAVVINAGATARLQSSILSPNATYNGAEAVTAYGVEARNENGYDIILQPYIQGTLDALQLDAAMRFASNLSSPSNIASILATSPQTIINPVSYTIVNLLPFWQPVATAPVFAGLIFVLIMSYFVVMIANGAREASRMNKLLSFKSLVALRLGSSFIAYFYLSLIYSFVNLAFKLDLSHTYGHGGFVIFWIFNWAYMLSVGLALEALITILKQFTPFFLITWIISNISVNLFPIEILPRIYHYGYAMPFYNISHAIRHIVFGTKNTLGLNFGVLIAWVAISCTTLTVIQWRVRQKDIQLMDEMQKNANESLREKQGA